MTDYIERDITWLYFNERVLQEAKDPSVPLYERLKFLAIFSSNLDEYFRVRVAQMRSFRKLKKQTRRKLKVKPNRTLKQIHRIVHDQQIEFGRVFREEILPQLEERGVRLLRKADMSSEQRDAACDYFKKEVKEHIQLSGPLTENPPFLANRGLYLIVQFKNDELGVVSIPTDKVSRFYELPRDVEGKHCITFLDDVLRVCLNDVFPKKSIRGAWSIKMSRDAELYIGDEQVGDLIDKIRGRLTVRDDGLPTRFLYDTTMPEAVLTRLQQAFKLQDDDLVPGGRYHNFHDFFGFPDPLADPSLHNEALPPLPHPAFEGSDDLMGLIRQRDRILHFPYQRYDYIPRLIREAADDSGVESIKITLYRVAKDSDVGHALLYAIERGKRVVVFVEAKARFDEQSNLDWGERLKKAGAQVLYSYPDIKVHTKLLVINATDPEDEDETRYVTYIGTSNFNEKTAALYTDHALLTAHPGIGRDVGQVFRVLERRILMPRLDHVLMAPFNLRSRFEEMIDREIALARTGRSAYLVIKMNSLEDRGMIEKLYDASRAGVRVRLLIRGICSLVPGVPGQSENIKITSIIDRFLEHARIYIFGNNGDEEMYIASADWMGRNLDRRVEVAAPIYDPTVYQELRQLIDFQLKDNTKARRIQIDQTNPYVHAPGKPERRSQVDQYRFLQSKLERTD